MLLKTERVQPWNPLAMVTLGYGDTWMDGGRLGSSDRLSLESKTSGNLRETNKLKKRYLPT